MWYTKNNLKVEVSTNINGKGAVIMNKEKIDEIISTVKLNDLLHKKEKEEKKSKTLWIFAIIGGVVSLITLIDSIVNKGK